MGARLTSGDTWGSSCRCCSDPPTSVSGTGDHGVIAVSGEGLMFKGPGRAVGSDSDTLLGRDNESLDGEGSTTSSGERGRGGFLLVWFRLTLKGPGTGVGAVSDMLVERDDE